MSHSQFQSSICLKQKEGGGELEEILAVCCNICIKGPHDLCHGRSASRRLPTGEYILIVVLTSYWVDPLIIM